MRHGACARCAGDPSVALGSVGSARPAARPRRARPASTVSLVSADDVTELQRLAGNAAVSELVQRHAGVEATRTAKKAEAVVDLLARAISREDVSASFDQGSRYQFRIDVERAAAALANLTPAEAAAVETRWRQREKYDLRQMIWGTVPHHVPTYLTDAAKLRLLALLGGTVPEVRVVDDGWGSRVEQSDRTETDRRAFDADVARLNSALEDRYGAPAVYDVLARRGGPVGSAARTALVRTYYDLADLRRRIETVSHEAKQPGDPATAGERLARAETVMAETRAALDRLPALAAVRGQRRAWAKDPAKAAEVALLDNIETLLRRGSLSSTEGRRYLARVRQQTTTRVAVPVTGPDAGLVLAGDLGPPSTWPARPTSYAESPHGWRTRVS